MADQDLRIRLLQHGVQDYLAKPFSEEELIARSRNLVSSHRARKLLQTELESTSENLETLADDLARRRRELSKAHERAAEASQAKSRFLSVISHELRTPINAVVG